MPIELKKGGDRRGGIEDLEQLVGLQSIKRELRKIESMLWLNKHRKQKDLGELSLQSFHFVFKGSPGTGKTTVARLIGQIFRKYGLLRSGDVVEVDRAKLVGPTPGETEVKVLRTVRSALDGVLFVDEAYALSGGGDTSDPGWRALEVLLKAMEDYRDCLVVIFAGYTHEMDRLFDSFTGLKSRFPFHLEFENYTPLELVEIANFMASRENLEISEQASLAIMNMMKKRVKEKDFSNAREIRNLIDHAKTKMSSRLRNKRKVTSWDLKTITILDLDDPYGETSFLVENIELAKKEMYADPLNKELRFKLAQRYEDAGLWSDVVATLEPVAKELSPPARALLGMALSKMGQHKEALEYLDGENLTPQHEFHKGISALWEGKRKEAIELLKDASEKTGEYPEFYLALSFAYFLEGQWGESFKTFREGLALIKKREGILPPESLRSLPYKDLKDEQVRQALERAVLKDFNNPDEALISFAEALLLSTSRGSVPDVIEEALRTALSNMPDDPRPHRGLAHYYKHKGEIMKAIVSLEVALELEPRNIEDWKLLAELYFAAGQKEKAEEVLHDVVYEQVGAGALALDLAKAEEQKGNKEEAERLYEKAWRQELSQEEKTFCADRLGQMKAVKGNFSEAMRYLEQVEISELSPEGQFWYARALIEARMWSKAEAVLRGIGPLPEELSSPYLYWKIRTLVAVKDLYEARSVVVNEGAPPWLRLASLMARVVSGDKSVAPSLKSFDSSELGMDGLGLLCVGLAGIGEWEGLYRCAQKAQQAQHGPVLWELQDGKLKEELEYLAGIAAAHMKRWETALEHFKRSHTVLLHPVTLYAMAVSMIALGRVNEAKRLSFQLNAAPTLKKKVDDLVKQNTGLRKLIAEPISAEVLDAFAFI